MSVSPNAQTLLSSQRARVLVPLLAVAVLAGCNDDAGSTRGRVASGPSPAAEFARPQARSVSSVASQGESGQPADAEAASVEHENIEERRHYTMRFSQTEQLVDTYQSILAACRQESACHPGGSGSNLPKQGLANGWIQFGIDRAHVGESRVASLIEQSEFLEASDITLENRTRQIIDVRARLQQKEALRDRLLALAQQAREFSQRNINELLQLERELARVQGEIESMQGQLRHLANVTERVNVRVDLRQDRWANENVSVFSPLRHAISESASVFFRSLGNVILAIVFITPWMVLGVPAIWVLVKSWKGLKALLRRRRS